MENKVCVYAICKDEIKFVDKWLDSMSEADYIVVLDTGSTDGTYEKLKSDSRVTKVKQKVIKPWRFDVARNESMKLVPKDANILVCTDFDEVFDPGWANILRTSWTEQVWRAKYLYSWNHTPTGDVGLSYKYDKIHTSTQKYQWKFPVHEVLELADVGLFLTEDTEINGNHTADYEDNIVLHHYPDMEKSRSNYFDLLKIRLEENPDEAFSIYLLGREYAVNGDYASALEYFQQTLEAPDILYYPLVQLIVLGYMGECHEMLGDNNSAILCYNLAIAQSNVHLESYIRLATLYLRLGYYRVAISFVEEGFARAYRHYDWTELAETWSYLPYDILSFCYLNIGNKEKALENVIKALKYNPNDERIRDNYLKILELN